MSSLANIQQRSRNGLGTGIRNLNWFVQTFDEYVVSMEPYIGRRFSIDEEQLRLVYFDWIELFESNDVEKYAKVDYWDCVDYVAGMGLTGLINKQPLSVSDEEFVAKHTDPAKIAKVFGIDIASVEDIPEIIKFWPEGFVYVCFCISFINELRQQKKTPRKKLNDEAFSLSRYWWSFRENAFEDEKRVLFFFDRILSNDPGSSTTNALESRQRFVKAYDRLSTDKDDADKPQAPPLGRF